MTDSELNRLIEAIKTFAITVVRESINGSDYGTWREEKSSRTRYALPLECRNELSHRGNLNKDGSSGGEMTGGTWNHSGRRSGGERPFRIIVSKNELEIFLQREAIRREFGEAGIKRYDEELEKQSRKNPRGQDD